DGGADRKGAVRARAKRAAVRPAATGIRGHRLRAQALGRRDALDAGADPARAAPAGNRRGGQAELERTRDLPLGAPWYWGQAVLLLQVPHHARARRTAAGKPGTAQREVRGAIQDQTR